MPVVLRVGGYKFWFYEADLHERPHVHVGNAGREAEFWLDEVSVARAGGFRAAEPNEIRRIIEESRAFLIDVWCKERDKYGNC